MKSIRGPGDSIATEVASYDGSVYRWHFLFAWDGFVMLDARRRGERSRRQNFAHISGDSIVCTRARRSEYSPSCATSGIPRRKSTSTTILVFDEESQKCSAASCW